MSELSISSPPKGTIIAMIQRAFIAITLFLFFGPALLHACTCSNQAPGTCPGLQKDDVVFLGTVASIETAPSPADAPVPVTPVTHYRFRVDEKFAGPNTPEIDVYSGGDDGDCGFVFKKGPQYVVFTQQETEGRLFSTLCNGTRVASDARALLPQLRAMRQGERVASVFGVIRRTNPPLLEPVDDPDDPLGHVTLKLRSQYDRFSTATDADGVYSFYDVHAGDYHLTANLPARMELTEKTLPGALPPVKIPAGACDEFDIDALPTGKIRGSVLGPDGKPLHLASVELYRSNRYEDARPGLWGFQGDKGVFEFDHIGPGDYLLVFNRMNRKDPNTPFPRVFYPGAPDASEAQPIHLEDGQQLLKVNFKLKAAYPTRKVHVHLKWTDGRLPGDIYVTAKASDGENPAARKIVDGLFEFTLLDDADYTFIAGEDSDPSRAGVRPGGKACDVPAHIDTPPVTVSGSDADTKQITLVFPSIACSD